MSKASEYQTTIKGAEELILKHFCNEPFHNLNLLYRPKTFSNIPGGTCSDKTLNFITDSKNAGFNTALHTGFINGQEIHRLVRINMDNRIFFADVGNGWPALQLIPADTEIEYSCFGMSFRTEILSNRIRVFHEKRGKEVLQLEIDPIPRPEKHILADINARYSSGIIYPFSNSIRFSLVVKDTFLFLRGSQLEIYGKHGFEALDGIENTAIPSIIRKYFGFDVSAYFDNLAT